MKKLIKDILEESNFIKDKIIKEKIDTITKIAHLIITSLKKGGKVIFFGNGGSASDSEHIAAELVGKFQKKRKALAAISLTNNTSLITALSNDYSYDIIFARQIEAIAHKNDIVIGISTSGKSKNVILGIKKAKKMGIKTIALTGGNGGSLKKLADISLIVPSYVTARVQEIHITIGHIVCELIEKKLFK